MKFSAIVATSALATAAMLPEQADAHAFLLLPKVDIIIPEKNLYAYVVPGEKVPPFSAYTTGNAEKNSQGFTANYKKLNPPTLRDFILKNEEPAKGVKPGGTAACGYSNPNGPAQPLPNHVEFGNYNLQISGGLHPGPCEAWCDDECVIPFTPDCRTLFKKPIPYSKDKCVGKSRFTFYWLATHFAPFQVYIGCAPLVGGKAGGGSGGAAGGGGGGGGGAKGNSTAPAGGGNGGGTTGGNDSNGGGKTSNEKKQAANNGVRNNGDGNKDGGNSGAIQRRSNNAPAQGGGTHDPNSQNAGRSLDFGDLNEM